MSVCGNPRHAACSDCSGEIIVGVYGDITVPRIDDDGFPEMDLEGNILTITLPLPAHVVDAPHSVWDPTSLIGSQCEHGLPEHPLPLAHAEGVKRGARSFIRSRYVTDGGKLGIICVVCRGEPRPDDLTTPRVAL